ncbi:hypothetical protein BDD21_4605 [Thiocapsa rosea]|uniref:Uncharacterized protein n=1 Tax=Thiocapsa rosea TaxID=69360 RepID=A0A495VCR2_9GAMM|nr:hypothetical protein BDD21_4605 [Thiocapsa rosea]
MLGTLGRGLPSFSVRRYPEPCCWKRGFGAGCEALRYHTIKQGACNSFQQVVAHLEGGLSADSGRPWSCGFPRNKPLEAL